MALLILVVPCDFSFLGVGLAFQGLVREMHPSINAAARFSQAAHGYRR